MDENVQPDEGQGDQSGGLFDSYLQDVPEDGRPTVESYLKDAERQVNSKLEKAAETERTWSPYSQIRDVPPEQLAELAAWGKDVLQSQDTLDAWIIEQAEQKGLSRQEAEELADDVEDGTLEPNQVRETVDQRAQELLSPLQEQVEELRTERYVDVETQAIESALSGLEKEHKTDLSEQDREVILTLGLDSATDPNGNELPVGDVSWVQAGFDRFREIGAAAQRAFVEEKAAQPASALTTGASQAQAPILDFKDAGAALRERLRAAQQT